MMADTTVNGPRHIADDTRRANSAAVSPPRTEGRRRRCAWAAEVRRDLLLAGAQQGNAGADGRRWLSCRHYH